MQNNLADFLCSKTKYFWLGTERYADIVLAVVTEDEARGYENSRLIQYLVRNSLTCTYAAFAIRQP